MMLSIRVPQSRSKDILIATVYSTNLRHGSMFVLEEYANPKI